MTPPPDPLKCIVYVSSATRRMTNADLKDILNSSHRNNLRNSITGLLLYSELTFMQFMEGPVSTVDMLFEQIARDARHADVFKLLDGPLPARNFGEWLMGFAAPQPAEMNEIAGYLKAENKISSVINDRKYMVLLKTFVKANGMDLEL